MILKRSGSLIVAATALLASAAWAGGQDPVPVDALGEEIFGDNYRPLGPSEEAVALEPGRPLAGFRSPQLDAIGNLDAVAAKVATERDADKRFELPLLRSVRRANRLKRFRAAPAAAPVAADVQPDASAELKVHFVNVGQGAGAILEFPCHTAIIDTGGEYAKGSGTVDGGKLFEAYLDAFFNARPERNRTIDVVFTSHPHEDHLAGLKHISAATGARAYRVRNVVDNGQTHDKGSLAAQRAFRTWASSQSPKARYSYVNFTSTITATGVTNSVIDPVGSCKGVDPEITVLWGAYNEKVEAGGKDWLNPNNHSLVVRVDFGRASFLFVGDLEDVGAKQMLREYEDNPGVFDVDVYHVSHHGAGNDTFDALVQAMTPDYAVLSMGTPDAQVKSTAWAYGHPRQKAIDVLQELPAVVEGKRPARTFRIASSAMQFKQSTISRAIYGTGWEGTLVMRASADGTVSLVP
jgi:beta-lactamase superfamily II metal-dependent hydrolase